MEIQRKNPSRHCLYRDARVYGHATTAIHGMGSPSPSLVSMAKQLRPCMTRVHPSSPLSCFAAAFLVSERRSGRRGRSRFVGRGRGGGGDGHGAGRSDISDISDGGGIVHRIVRAHATRRRETGSCARSYYSGMFKGWMLLCGPDRVGSDQTWSGRVRPGRVGSDRVGSGQTGSDRVGPGRVRVARPEPTSTIRARKPADST